MQPCGEGGPPSHPAINRWYGECGKLPHCTPQKPIWFLAPKTIALIKYHSLWEGEGVVATTPEAILYEDDFQHAHRLIVMFHFLLHLLIGPPYLCSYREV